MAGKEHRRAPFAWAVLQPAFAPMTGLQQRNGQPEVGVNVRGTLINHLSIAPDRLVRFVNLGQGCGQGILHVAMIGAKPQHLAILVHRRGEPPALVQEGSQRAACVRPIGSQFGGAPRALHRAD